MASAEGRHQNIIVMRHGDRIDNFEPLWISTADRPWDPPLIDEGLVRAFCTGRKLRNQIGFPIHRVFVSPFIRCVQTASEAVSALCAVNDDPSFMTSKDGVDIDPSKLRVSIEYGLCEMLNKEAIRINPKDGNWGFKIQELESLLPNGTVDQSVECVYKEMPQWEETVSETRTRYAKIIKALADKYPSENLLLVTHGEAVGVAISAFLERTTVFEVEYCAFAHLRRPISDKGADFTAAGEFEVLTRPGQNGVSYLPPTCSDY